mmetsp:Transcript_15573/g.18760  ORF Transcript_15573/g.18760 Transcript_15573/m.18760 type:complete len:308 (+) Transcript_15573:128-1051(+)|eukprot:jgi/Bigna1/89044/estExt_fgenesh1_pg.C_430002
MDKNKGGQEQKEKKINNVPSMSTDGGKQQQQQQSKDEEHKQPKLRQAEWHDLSVGMAVYVRGRKAEVLRMTHPLIYWVFEGDKSEKHRSFIFDKAMFQVEELQQSERKGSSFEGGGEPLMKKISDLENEEIDCNGVTPKHTVEIMDCKSSSITILGEVYGIHLSNCQDITLLFSSVVASCDMAKCTGCKIYCMSECCLFDIQESKSCEISLGKKLLNNVLFSTINSSAVNVTVLDEISAEIVEMLKDGEDLEQIVSYEIPKSGAGGLDDETADEVELRTKWNGQAFECKKVETKEISPDFDKEFDPF